MSRRETHSFASLLHNRFAFIVAIVIEKNEVLSTVPAIKPVCDCFVKIKLVYHFDRL